MCAHFVERKSKAQRDEVIYLNWEGELKFKTGSNFKAHALLFSLYCIIFVVVVVIIIICIYIYQALCKMLQIQ